MRYFLRLTMIILFLYPLVLHAQEDISVRKKDFKSGKAGFTEAWKHVENGDDFYSDGAVFFRNAFDEYLLAFIYNSTNAELNYKTGASALLSDRKEEAAGFLLKAHELKKDVAGDILFLSGRALQYTGRFDEAINSFNEYLTSPGKKPAENIAMAKKYIEECNFALILTRDTLGFLINNLDDSINTASDEYSAIFSSDGETLYFGSRRELPHSSSYYPDSKFDENIFISKQTNGSWGTAMSAGKSLLTKYCETPLYISSDNNILYLYSGYENDGDIKMAVLNKKGQWKDPEAIPYNINTGDSETSFTFAPSGDEIYYVTDSGKDNLGGKDIYFIKKLNEKKWSKPQNAGPVINTVYDEESVRFSVTGDTLWFSSKGHNSMGGFDIFYSVRNQDGMWDSVRNSGYPVNTSWDELFYYPSPVNDSMFYFASNRSGGFGGLDIYQGIILPPVKPAVIEIPVQTQVKTEPDTVFIRDTLVVIKEQITAPLPAIQPAPEKEEVILFLTGTVKDSETGEPVIAKIDIIDLSSDLVIATTASSDIDGSYRIRLPERKPYMIDLRATGFMSDLKRVNIPASLATDSFTFDAVLTKVKVGTKVVLNNILFQSGKSVLTADSYSGIDRLVNFMKDNPQVKIEISGHTDKTGSEPLNLKLSENRAKAVADYLIQKEIARERIEYKGFGSVQPIADNATPKGRTENRRVEFKILEF